jgi:hypothetical protein
MNARTPTDSQVPKGARRRRSARRPGCRACPLRDPSGKCRDPRLKSGRCGDWIWYLRRGKQLRRLWTKVRDPRSSKQLYWRKLLSAASKRYSAALTYEQQNACIAAGSKLRSRPRLGQWGYLTGQQYWVRQECKGKAPGPVPKAKTCAEPLQTKEISASTWEPHRDTPVTPPGEHRRTKGIPRVPGRASILARPNIRRVPGIQVCRRWRWMVAEPERGPPVAASPRSQTNSLR